MKTLTTAKIIIATALILMNHATAVPAADSGLEPMLSYQSFSGIINTPAAHAQKEGTFQALYNNQINRIGTNLPPWQDNYVFSVGLFNFVELGGRLTDGGARDLSANIKISSAPLTAGNSLIPVFAAGVQDMGGGSNLLQSRYLVVSEDIWRFRFSGGYGFGPNQMDGVFGGVEFKLHDYVYLLADYDARESNAGIRLISPELWKTPVRLNFSAKTTIDPAPKNIDVAFGMTFPLDFKKAPRTGAAVEIPGQKGSVAAEVKSTAEAPATHPPPPTPRPTDLASLRERLGATGLTGLRVGQRGKNELFIEYENSIYNHNELDALGIVAGIAAESAPDSFETVHMVIKRKGIRMADISAPLTSIRSFMEHPDSIQNLKDTLSINYSAESIPDISFLADEQKSVFFPNTALVLSPGLTTFVGTEVGAFDYLLSLKPEIISDLWKGGVLNARWDIPISWSENLDKGNTFYNSRSGSRMDRLMLFQAVKPTADIMANLGGGMILHDTYGTLNEIMWSPGAGSHRLRGAQAWARNPETERTSEVYLGSYRYLLAPLDLSFELTAGRFWGQDHGYSLEMKRFFGDTSVSTYYKNSTTSAGKQWQAAGIQFSFPLTPYKALQVGPIQVRGSDEWNYGQETTLAIGSQKTNDVLTQALAINPQPTPALYRTYYNRDRLSASYIRQHLSSLREAWLKYKSAN